MTNRYTPERITSLKPNEIFVFGSNLAGNHGGGAARLAYDNFGAVWGQGTGLQGQSYAIPTMQGGVETIKPYIDEFISFARKHKELLFYVTRIGCGIAGFKDEDIAPLFVNALNDENILFPESFVIILKKCSSVDPFFLKRFVDAQEQTYETALHEIEDGFKVSHWIWWVFPQLSILGKSANSKFYGISGSEEAEAYLSHPILGARLREATRALLQHSGEDVSGIFGALDAAKVKSCMTLFDAISPNDIFNEALKTFFHNTSCKVTLEWM